MSVFNVERIDYWSLESELGRSLEAKDAILNPLEPQNFSTKDTPCQSVTLHAINFPILLFTAS